MALTQGDSISQQCSKEERKNKRNRVEGETLPIFNNLRREMLCMKINLCVQLLHNPG